MDTNFNIADASELEKQQSYADKLANQGFDFGLAVGSAFAESMRNTYYRHTGTALDEIVDNAIEAGAANILVAFGFLGKSDKKPDSIAVIDNGHGMPLNMIRLAVLWGGTHREGSRNGFGRFGFGLPSASVNQARRYSVYSLVKGGKWNGVTIDLDDIRNGKYTDQKTGRVVAPEPAEIEPPKWIKDEIHKNMPDGSIKSGTIVHLEKADRLTWKTASTLKKNLSEHFGVTYRNYLSRTHLKVDGETVEPTDPLFITPGYRYYDLDEDRARALDPAEFEVSVKDSDEKVKVRIRYSYLPRTFFRKDKSKDVSRTNANQRFPVMLDNFGIIVNRMGRQVDVVQHTPWNNLEKFRNDDRHWAAEIDFPAELDEEFTVSNNKQGVYLSERLWDLLKQAGMESAIRHFRNDLKAERDKDNETPEDGSEGRISERSMEDAEKFKKKRPDADPSERLRKAEDNLDQYVKRKAKETNRSEQQVRKEVEEEAAKHPYRVEFEDMPGAPFFRVEQLGGMKVLFINRGHRFYGDVYSADANRKFRASLEVLLFVIGECELDAQGNPDRRLFYASERQEWSLLLSSALELLSRYVDDTEIVDEEASNKSDQKEAAE